MRYSIKEKRRFHFRLTSTARLTKSEPVFQFRSLGLADDDFLGHRHFQVLANRPLNHRLMSDTAFRDTIN